MIIQVLKMPDYNKPIKDRGFKPWITMAKARARLKAKELVKK